jgi:hypothetical protein
MAGCGDQGCNCAVIGGAGITVTGSGTARDPYEIELETSLEGTFVVEDTNTVNLSLVGQGIPGEPYRLSAVATMRLTQLADVLDPQGGPNVGDVPVWVGGAEPHWEFQPPPANPAGAVNVSTGIAGDGSAGAPIRVRLIGTSAGGSTTGLEVYADSAGNLRAVAPVAQEVAWNSITGKPASFPTTASDFSGTLPVSKGGTGASSLADIKVGDTSKIDGRLIYTQSGTPSGTIPLNSLWLW